MPPMSDTAPASPNADWLAKANVLSEPMWAELEAAVDSLAARTDLRGLVIASAKPGIFIAGADLKLLANAPRPNDPAVRAFIDHTVDRLKNSAEFVLTERELAMAEAKGRKVRRK